MKKEQVVTDFVELNVQLPRTLVEKLHEQVVNLKNHWHPSQSEADYVCEFCGKRPRTNLDLVVHEDGCFGEVLSKLLNDALNRA